MARTKLPDRRSSVTEIVTFTTEAGKQIKVHVTFGFNLINQVCEVFCADFKAGTSMQAIIMDACVLMSRLLQHGDTPAELAATLCNPPSLLGSILKASAKLDEEAKS